MRQFLTKPRSIIGATLWGVIVAVITFVALLIFDLIISMYRNSFGPAEQMEAIAVGGGYSIALDADLAHPMLAEYEQSIRIYGVGPRSGDLLGRVAIPMNTGGRVRIGILVPQEAGQPEVVLADRYATTSINLTTQKTSDVKTWRDESLRPIGIWSGESYPIKFIPCSIWPMLPDDEREYIMGGRGLEDFCDGSF